MKEKLTTMRNKAVSLRDMAGEEMDFGSSNSTVQCAYVKGGEIVALIDEILATIESPELVEEVAASINNSHPKRAYEWDELIRRSPECLIFMKEIIDRSRIQAQAAINTIKERI